VCGICELQNVREAELLQFCFKEVTFDPYHFKCIVMLLVLYLVVVASLVTL
jgi:hypothetical protein